MEDDQSSAMTIENNNAFLMAMGDGSRIEIHAADASKKSWTQIDATAQAGATQITLAENAGWAVGDKIAIASTVFDMNEAEERTIAAVSDDGLTITFEPPLDHTHFGEIVDYDNGLDGLNAQSWSLDMRAEVALLSRNVTIQGDADSAVDGYGGHTMVMNGAEMHIDGAEFTQMGQQGLLGRYALHWHMLGDASGQYVTNTSIHQTYNKGMTIHGTQNTWVEGNAIYDTIGHTYYFEDGSEFGNVLKDNLGMNTRQTENVSAGPIGSDHTAVSTYWVTNPNNHLVGNHAAGSDKVGFWILSQDHTEGASAESGLYDDYVPRAQTPGQWVGNASHSNGTDGIFIGRQFDETTGEAATGDRPLEQQYQITDFTTYKNDDFGLWIRNGSGSWDDVKIADSKKGARFWGLNDVEDSLIVGRSENSEDVGRDAYHGWELYDQATHLQDVHFDGFDGDDDAAIANHSGFGRSTNNSVDGLTFGDQVDDDNVFRTKVYSAFNDGVRDNGGSLAGALFDLDGGLTGQPGAVITPGIVDVTVGAGADVLNRAFDGIEAAGFNAADSAVWNADGGYWVNPAGSVIGKVNFRSSANEAERVDFIITRADNGSQLLYGGDTQQGNSRGQLNVDGRGDVEYVVEYPDGPPSTIRVDLIELPEGATVYFRFQDLSDDVAVQGADAVGGRAALDAANGTAWYRAGNGDIVVKTYADRFGARRGENDETLPFVAGEVYGDEFRILVDDPGAPSGDFAPRPAPDDYRPDPTPAPLPDRAASTSSTIDVTDDMPRWSTASTWDAGVPNAESIVVVGSGETVILDTSATVKGIIVDGGALVIKDDATATIDLASDYVLVINGGLFQAGTEDDLLDTQFTLTLEGDDPDFDLQVTDILNGDAPNIVNVATQTDGVDDEPPIEDDPAALLGSISGVVVDGAEVGVSAVRLVLLDGDGDGDTVSSTMSRANGAYTFELLAPGQYRVLIEDAEDPTELVSVVAGETTTVAALVLPNVDDAAEDGAGENDAGENDAGQDDAGQDDAGPIDPSEDAGDESPPEGGLQVFGDDDANTLFGAAAAEEFFAGDGDDTVIAGWGNDLVYGGAGRDVIRGSKGADELYGGDGDDLVVSGDRGDDVIFGGAGDDVLRGGQGQDMLDGEDGDDRVIGDRGGDVMRGGDGDDALLGHLGDDFLFGGSGLDVLVGGAGADVFIVEEGDGRDVVRDFEDGVDKIDISGYDGVSLDAVLGSIRAASLGGVVVDIGVDPASGAQDTLVMRGVEVDHITADDFIL